LTKKVLSNFYNNVVTRDDKNLDKLRVVLMAIK